MQQSEYESKRRDAETHLSHAGIVLRKAQKDYGDAEEALMALDRKWRERYHQGEDETDEAWVARVGQDKVNEMTRGAVEMSRKDMRKLYEADLRDHEARMGL